MVTSVKRIHDMVQQGTVPGKDYEQVCMISGVWGFRISTDSVSGMQCSHYFQGVGTTGVDQDWDEGCVHLIVRGRGAFEAATGAGMDTRLFAGGAGVLILGGCRIRQHFAQRLQGAILSSLTTGADD